GRLDLTVGQVATADRLDGVVTEGNLGPALGGTGPLGVVLLAVLDLTRDQHRGHAPCSLLAGASAATAAVLSVRSSARSCSRRRPPRSGRSPRAGRRPPGR